MPRPCCKYKRSANDALLDTQTRATYCGTCWNHWLTAQPRASPSSPVIENKAPSIDTETALFPDDNTLGELTGITHKDGTLYLASRTTRLVFHIDRTPDGQLRQAGVLTRQDQLCLHAEQDVQSLSSQSFPFEVHPEDHCETPFVAYADLAPYLEFLAKLLGKDRASLRIWDPYYCTGGIKKHLACLGFTCVHNECVDFYKLVASGQLPKHDCIVTNPPYSTTPIDHVQRLVRFLCEQRSPWFVVQPNYVYTKPFWEEYTAETLPAPRPFFLTPATPRKYKYKTPEGLRDISNQQLKTSPFVSMWYCWLGPAYTEKLYRWVAEKETVAQLPLSIACTEFFLPDSFKDSNDKTRRKPRKSKKRTIDHTSVKGPQSENTTPSNKKKRKRRNKP